MIALFGVKIVVCLVYWKLRYLQLFCIMVCARTIYTSLASFITIFYRIEGQKCLIVCLFTSNRTTCVFLKVKKILNSILGCGVKWEKAWGSSIRICYIYYDGCVIFEQIHNIIFLQLFFKTYKIRSCASNYNILRKKSIMLIFIVEQFCTYLDKKVGVKSIRK